MTDPRNVPYAQKAYFFQIWCTNVLTSMLVSISTLPRLSIHLTGVACQEADLNSVSITQGHSKMCSFVTQYNAMFQVDEHAIGRNVGMSTRAVGREFVPFYALGDQCRFREFGSTSNQPHNLRPRVSVVWESGLLMSML